MIVIGGNLIIPPIYKERKYNMSKLYVKPENIIENPTAKTLKELLMNGEYIICGDLKDKNIPFGPIGIFQMSHTAPFSCK